MSDCFEPNFPQTLELVVKVISRNNIHGGILQEYLDFCEFYNKNVRTQKTAGEKIKGLKETINTCIDNGVLKDFLEHHRKEVETMLMTVFPPEQALEFVLLDEYNKGVEAGEARGIENEKIKIAKDMKKEGLEPGFIMKLTGLSKEVVETL